MTGWPYKWSLIPDMETFHKWIQESPDLSSVGYHSGWSPEVLANRIFILSKQRIQDALREGESEHVVGDHEYYALELYIKQKVAIIIPTCAPVNFNDVNFNDITNPPWTLDLNNNSLEHQQQLNHLVNLVDIIVDNPSTHDVDMTDCELGEDQLQLFLERSLNEPEANITGFCPGTSTRTSGSCGEPSDYETSISTMDTSDDIDSCLKWSYPYDTFIPVAGTESTTSSSVSYSGGRTIPVSTSVAKSGVNPKPKSKVAAAAVTTPTEKGHLFQCSYCNKTFSKKAELNRHWTQATKGCTAVMDSNKEQCRKCGRTLDDGEDHANHFGRNVETEFLPQKWMRKESELQNTEGKKKTFPFFMRRYRKTTQSPWIVNHVRFVDNPKKPQEPKPL